MTPEALRLADASEQMPPSALAPSSDIGGGPDESGSIELSSKLRAELLDFDAWGVILETYGRTMKVAVALVDARGRALGQCHNAQPVWSMVQDAAPPLASACPFCITIHQPCTAVQEALQTGGVVMARDQAGLTHVTVPLLLGEHRLGAILAGQVFDRYPEMLPLRRVAKEFGVSEQELWDLARKQRPVSRSALQASGDLLCALGQAFLQQRYGAILKAKLAMTNLRFRLLVEGVRDYALFTMDPSGDVTSWNGGAERMLGYAAAKIVGQNFACIFTPEEILSRVPEKQLHRALQAGRVEDEGWRVRENQNKFWANVNITSLEDGGTVDGFAIIMHDETERRKVTIFMEDARRERARLQEKLLSHVSHELRTPLTAIYFFTTNVLDGLLGDLTPEQHEHLAFALDNVKQLKDMVSDLLDITRVETRKLTVDPQHTSPVKLIAEALSTCRTNAAAKNISLRSDIAPGLPYVWADPARVRQILINLIDNGIKFTPDGGVVTVESRPAEDDDFLCFSVADTGCGISPNNRDAVFERLAQVKSGADASRSGLGLGLFIAKELVLRHGGRIWVESQLEQGSTFYFTLPVFSLAKLCSRIFTASNLEAGEVTLITVDVVAVGGASQPDIATELCKVLGRCIHAGQDVLLPSMRDADPLQTLFIVACTGDKGFAAIASRIRRELQSFDSASKLQPIISSTTLSVSPGQSRAEQIADITERIERSVQSHLLSKEKVK